MAHGCDFGNFKVVKSLAKSFTTAKYRDPAEPGLKSFQTDRLKQLLLTTVGIAPFLIVVLQVGGVISNPTAAGQPIGMSSRVQFLYSMFSCQRSQRLVSRPLPPE